MACLCSIIRAIYIWILFLHIVTLSRGYSPDDSVCDIADIEPAQVLQCSDRNSIPITISSIVPTGSSCDIICPYKEVKVRVTCDDGELSYNYQSYCTGVSVARKRRSRPKRWLFGLFVGLFFNALFGRRSNRDNTPPSLTCPPNIQATAVQLQTWAVVSWAEPTANDGRDGGITPTRQGKAPGSYFSEGVTPVGYYARDKSGNMARCSFTVTVNVVRCTWPARVNNGYFMCHPSDDARYGATCRFGCHPGYKSMGNSLLECLVTGQWNNNQPYCEKKTCPTLPPSVGSLQYTCTNSNKFRSICTYSCISGYDITPGMSRVRVCTAYGTWRGAEPTCTDIEPPVFQGCQQTVYAYADRNLTTGVATWTEPIAVDNHDTNVVVQKEKSTSPSPGDRLSAGNYKIVYKAVDAAGNKAQSCQTEVILKVLTCPVVYPTPFLSVTCPWGTKYGSQCEFDCDPGSVRNGSQSVVCEKSGTGNYGYWTFSGNKQPYCEVIQKCLDKPNIPQNGALACDNWIGGKFCQMLCQQGYDVKIGRSTIDMLVCGDSGKWLPASALPLPDCAKSIWADRGHLRMSASYYFTGDCTNVLVQEEIKNKFIKTLSTSSYKDACLVFAKDCKVDNVQVKCGHIGRRKRSGDMRIDFDITAEFDNVSSADSFAQFHRHQSDIVEKIIEAKSDGILDFNVTGSGFMESKDFEIYDVILDCPERTVPSYKTLTCAECSAGTYYNTTSETCEICPRGTFQSLSGQLNCLPCPLGQTTTSAGTKQQSQCHDGCQPGSWSLNGVPECSLCAVGTYSDSYGETECTRCPGSTSTVEEGTDSILKCQEYDLRMTESESQVSADVDFSGITMITLTFWLKGDVSTTGNFTIQLKERDTSKIIFFMDIGSETKIGDQREVKTATNTGNGKWHFYILKQNNDSTELYEDGELRIRTDLPFTNSMNMSISCNGSGTISRLNVWKNGPLSFSRILEIASKCSSSETGDILSWRTFELTSNDNAYIQMPSECDDVDDCLSDPCINGGKCTDLSSGYECQCNYGFKGNSCEENIDDCADHACENNATCIDGAANYTCDCPGGYKGELCEIAMVDGSWSDWGEWSSCSVTCGNGTQQRFRVCNDPAPENGGLDCPDSSTENRTCTKKNCPECSQLEQLANLIWTCVNDSENINCTIACADGYDFDHEVKPYYLCGIDTFYLWDFQTDDNPAGKMPACQKMKDSEKLRVSYVASYKDLECDSSLKYTNIHKSVPETVQLGLDTIECVSTGVCFLDRVTVTDCSKRQKRSLPSSTAGIYVSFSCDPISHGTDTCYNSLYSAVNDLQLLAMNSTLDVDILGSTYSLNASNARADSSVTCSTGMVPIQFYCIPCAPGRYYRKEECVKCDFGTYQDLSGQLSCKECPDGTTTPGRESRSVIECSVKYDTELNATMSIIVGITVSAVLMCILVISFVVVRRCIFPWKSKEKEMPKISSSDQTAVIERNTDEVLLMKPSDIWTTVISPRSLKQENALHKNGEEDIDVIHLH